MSRRCLPLLPLLLSVIAWGEEPIATGIDVIEAAKTAQRLLLPAQGDPDKPWSVDLANLTDPSPAVHAGAIRNLVVRGSKVLPDLEALAGDRDVRVRSRVLQVAGGIGGEAGAPLVLRLSNDREAVIQEMSALALGRCRGPGVRERLEQLLDADQAAVRESAAKSLGALGDAAAVPRLARLGEEADDRVAGRMNESLRQLVFSPAGAATAAQLIAESQGDVRDDVLAAVETLGDPRLCPVLVSVAMAPASTKPGRRGRDASAWTQLLAIRALLANGDARALEAMIRLATDAPLGEARDAAAETLRIRTGFPAQAGEAWRIWWSDNATRAAVQGRRDSDMARWTDPGAPLPGRAELVAWTPDQLLPLIEAYFGRPAGRLAPWIPARALLILRQDDPRRWSNWLADRYLSLPSSMLEDRLGLLLLIDALGGPEVPAIVERLTKDLDARIEKEKEDAETTKRIAPDQRPVRLCLERMRR